MIENDTQVEGTADTLGAAIIAEQVADLEAGTRIHRYLILELIGKGGMGAVYKAYDPELDRRIAIKLLTLSPKENQTLSVPQARLMREAQALAKLSHPNVVAVFDVGTYQTSVYIAMEYIQGKTLRDWLQIAQPTQQEILDVFLAAGHGLMAAHAQGIVHRDFKPENLLVGDKGEVKILDFGLARASEFEDWPLQKSPSEVRQHLESKSSDQLLSTPLTQAGILLGTVAYMAPEHFRRQKLDAHTDQFSYCVSLFESLYGRRPFRGDTLSQLEKNVTTGQIELPKVHQEPDWIQHILQRGLSTSKEQRFASMEELLIALAADPIGARRIRRRRQALVAVVVFLALLPFGLWYSFFRQPEVCTGAPRKLHGIWSTPVKEKTLSAFTATQLTYAQDTFARVDQRLSAYLSAWAKEYTEVCQATQVLHEQSAHTMDLRMACLDQHLGNTKALVEILSAADAQVVKKSVMAVASLSGFFNCRDSRALRSPVLPPADQQTKTQVEAVRNRLVRIAALRRAGKVQEAQKPSAEALALAEKTGYAPVIAEALLWRGMMLEASAQYQAAIQLLKKAAVLADKNKYDKVRAQAMVDILWILGERLSQFDEAMRLNEWIEGAVLRVDDQRNLESNWLNNLGNMYDNHGDYAKALACYQETLKIRAKIRGADHPEVARCLNNLGVVYYNMGDYDKVIEYFRRAIAIKEKALGPNHPSLANSYNNLGEVLESKGQFAQALVYHQRARAIWQEALGSQHPLVATSLYNIAEVYGGQGKLAKARHYYQLSLQMRSEILGKDHPYVALSLCGLGFVSLDLREYKQAHAQFESALTILQKSLGVNHRFLAWAHSGLGWVYLRQKKQNQARQHFERVQQICQNDRCKNDEGDGYSTSFVGLAQSLWLSRQKTKRAIALAREGQKRLLDKHSVFARQVFREAQSFLAKHGS